MEFTRERATSAVGTGALEHLESVVGELARSYQTAPPTELFPIARAYRQRVAQLIDGRHTLHEARELYVYASRLSYLLSDVSHDLNSWLTAEAYGIDGQEHAHQAGHKEMYAWTADAAVGALFHLGRAGDSIKVALKGLRQVSEQHPLAVRLRAKAARSYARQGNHTACEELLGEARRLCDRLPDQVPSIFSDTNASTEYTRYCLTSYAATCYVWLAKWTEAERYARDTLGVAALSPGRAAVARLDLAIALANLGSPDEAAEYGTRALGADRWLGALLPRARQLNAALTTRYPEISSSQAFHDRYHQLTTTRATN
jgi:tetratricopeptide (TPR) repeat protein